MPLAPVIYPMSTAPCQLQETTCLGAALAASIGSGVTDIATVFAVGPTYSGADLYFIYVVEGFYLLRGLLRGFIIFTLFRVFIPSSVGGKCEK